MNKLPLFSFLLALVCAGCGQKGALYLPAELKTESPHTSVTQEPSPESGPVQS